MPKRLLAILLFGILFSSTLTASITVSAQEAEHHEVIVIGAGISGVTAANKLDKKGIDVIVLESQERIGGRLWTVYPANDTNFNLDESWKNIGLDVGASWIHGIDGNPLVNLAENFTTVFWDEHDKFLVFDDDGNEVDDTTWEDIDNLTEEFKEFLKTESDIILKENEDKILSGQLQDMALSEVIEKFIDAKKKNEKEITPDQENFLRNNLSMGI